MVTQFRHSRCRKWDQFTDQELLRLLTKLQSYPGNEHLAFNREQLIIAIDIAQLKRRTRDQIEKAQQEASSLLKKAWSIFKENGT